MTDPFWNVWNEMTMGETWQSKTSARMKCLEISEHLLLEFSQGFESDPVVALQPMVFAVTFSWAAEK
jgi:hypothetical protein